MENRSSDFDLIVIGGGAAGFFGAIQAAEMKPGQRILILEKTSKLLTKVKVSGGGRCNVTHACFNPFELARHYPRGEKKLKESFRLYNARNVVDWFSRHGVELKTESDGRMFPETNDSETIIACFLREALSRKIRIENNKSVVRLTSAANGFIIETASGETWQTSKVLVAIGGNSNAEAYHWIRALGHTVVPPIPSLFTFNDNVKTFKDLMGISIANAEVSIAGTKFRERGPVLITHWGFSGPAIIKLSAWAAVDLHQRNYQFDARVNWTGLAVEACRESLSAAKLTRSKQKIHGNGLFDLPLRLWVRLCELSEIETSRVWSEVSHREMNKLGENLVNTVIHVRGKTTFREEFVTCGGVSLKDVDPLTFESKLIRGLYFAGEVLDIDGETGGFNFQAAWSTSYLAARRISGTVA